MNFVQILAGCDADLVSILSLVKLILNAIRWVVPIILIVLTTLDVAKIVTAGNLDDKLKKEVGQKITTRLIYAIIIFLIPTIVSLLFRLLGNSTVIQSSDVNGCTWSEAYNQA